MSVRHIYCCAHPEGHKQFCFGCRQPWPCAGAVAGQPAPLRRQPLTRVDQGAAR